MKKTSLLVVPSRDLRGSACVTRASGRRPALVMLAMLCLVPGMAAQIVDEEVLDALAMGSS